MDTERTIQGGRFIGPLKTKWHPDKLEKQKPSRALSDTELLAMAIHALVDLVDALDGVRGVDLEKAKTAAEAAIAQTVEEAR